MARKLQHLKTPLLLIIPSSAGASTSTTTAAASAASASSPEALSLDKLRFGFGVEYITNIPTP